MPPTPVPPTPVPPPPAGNRAALPVDEQAREKAVLFALEAAGVPAALWSEFLTVGWCEGRWDPTAYNPGVQVGLVWVGPFYGVWQAEKLWWDLAGEPISEDVNAQARVMWATYQYNLQRSGYGWAAHHCQP
ncbi:MAG: hypothetical protein ACSLE9_07815 [Burkholderiaceae bacterium]